MTNANSFFKFYARLSKQSGFTLIEMMVSSAVGILVLMTVSTVYLKGQDLAFGRAHQLAITQDAFDALRMIKEEIQRAGYSPDSRGLPVGESVFPPDASGISYEGVVRVVSQPVGTMCVAMVYRALGNRQYQNSAFFWKKSEGKLVYRSIKGRVTEDVSYLCNGKYAEQLLDENLYKVTEFNVRPEKLTVVSGSSSTMSGFYNIDLEIEPKVGSDICKYGKSNICKYSLSVKPRNWKS